MVRRKIKIFGVILIILLFVSCKTSKVINNIVRETGIYVGDTALNFTETDSNGNPFILDSLKGKVILLNFSAMWCSPCRNEASHLMEIYNTYKERGLEIVQCIFEDEGENPSDLSDLKRWIDEFNISFLVVNDPDYSTVNAFKISSIPANFLIDRSFLIQYRQTGFYKTEVIRKIEELL